MPSQIDRYEVKVLVSPTLVPLGASVTAWREDDTYSTTPIDCGPFDELSDVYAAVADCLPLQLPLT